MSFNDLESSVDQGAPFKLYQFTHGLNDVYRYTDHEREITFAGDIYSPIPIDSPAIVTKTTLERENFKVTLAASAPIIDLYRGRTSESEVSLIIREGHINDPDDEVLVAWTGSVLSGSRVNRNFELLCEPISVTMKRNALRRRMQYTCPHVLYGEYCTADRTGFTVNATVLSVTGNDVELGPGWSGAFDPNAFIGGLIEWDDSGDTRFRAISRIRPSGETVVVAGRAAALTVGQSIDLFMGCDKTLSTCTNRFNNVVNFGGCPYIPTENPVKTNPFG